MATNDVTARKLTEAQVIDRAMKDPAYRAELVADPKAVFARELGVDVPDTLDVQVVEETPTTVYLVLPQATPSVTAELSDAELDRVAGGWSGPTNGGCGSCGDATCAQTCPSIAHDCTCQELPMRTQYVDGWGDLSLLTLGGGGIGQVWGATTRAEAVATVHDAVDAGITLLDLAPSYGDGEAELVVGAAFGGTLPDGVRVTTKYGLNAPPADQVLSLLEHSLDSSLRRMRLEQVDVFFLHCSIVPDELAGQVSGTPRSLFVESVRPAFEHLVETGKIKAWGITGVTVPSAVLHTLDEDPKPAMVQAITNLMDATGALPHDGEAPRPREIVARAARRGIGVLGIRALAAGALADAIDRPVPSDAPVMQDFQRATPFRALAEELGTPAATLAHRYALSMAGITSIVLGVKNRDELREALDAEAAGPLDAETIARVDALGLAPAVS